MKWTSETEGETCDGQDVEISHAVRQVEMPVFVIIKDDESIKNSDGEPAVFDSVEEARAAVEELDAKAAKVMDLHNLDLYASEVLGESVTVSDPAVGGRLVAVIHSEGWYCSYTSPNETHLEHWVGAWRTVETPKRHQEHQRGYGDSMGEAAARALASINAQQTTLEEA